MARRWKRVATLGFCAALALLAPSARGDDFHEGTFWTGYMSSWWLDERWGLWFDTHYNVDTFFVARGGLSHRFEKGPTVTGGYAFLLLNPDFDRHEHRPWWQIFYPYRFDDNWSISGRLRMDFRFLEKLEDGRVTSGHEFVWRPRIQSSVMRRLSPIRAGRPFLQFSHELLINGAVTDGRKVLDQNRLSLLWGLETKWVTLRVGYMHRWLPNARGGDGQHEHAAIVWFTQSTDLPRRVRGRRFKMEGEDNPEFGGP
ncbi:MAG: DUF2490 domain-containing protein [Myxococcota bacterium]|nr:DUF2490 domain-containing protein [Myxococcota bacterium]